MAAVAQQTAPPLMHFALAWYYLDAGYYIRRWGWDGTDHDKAWLLMRNGIVYYIGDGVDRICQGTKGATRGDVMAEDLLARDWTTLGIGCDGASDCPCGDAILNSLIPALYTEDETDVTLDLDNPNSTLGLGACDLPPRNWLDALPSDGCDCFTPLDPDTPQRDLLPASNDNGSARGGSGGGDSGGGSTSLTSGSGGGGGGGGGGAVPKKKTKTTGGASLVMTLTRTSDTPVSCDEHGVCPAAAPNGVYSWFGSATFSAPGNTNAWSTILRVNSVFGITAVSLGNVSDGGTKTFGPIAMPAGLAPGAGFTVSVTCTELLGDGQVQKVVAALVPPCDCAVIRCPDPENPEMEMSCPDGEMLAPDTCDCIPVPACDSGKQWSDAAQACCDEAGTDLGYTCDGTTKITTLADGDCGTTTSEETDSPDCGA